MKQQALKAFLGLMLAAFILVMLEGMLWLLNVPDRGIYDGDPATVWWLKPKLNRELPHSEGHRFRVQTNELGLRGPMPPQAGDWILALGCSTTFGWGVEAEESWPQLLSDKLNVPVINGGMPGWSTHQAKVRLAEWPDALKNPSAVILAYWVRDAQLAPQADSKALPTPWAFRLQLGRLLGQALRSPHNPPALIPRVSRDAYIQNLNAIKAIFPKRPIYGLFFPQIEGNPSYQEALAAQTHLLDVPAFSAELFFETDPIHLTAEGHQQLATALQGQLP